MEEKRCNVEKCEIFQDIIDKTFGYCSKLCKDSDDPLDGIVLKNTKCQIPELEKIYGKGFFDKVDINGNN